TVDAGNTLVEANESNNQVSVLRCGDADGDGFLACIDDCNDGDAGIHPGAIEVCNSVDDNCNGSVDEVDADGDGFSKCVNDCNDGNAGIHPGATELCNFIDDNCNNFVDEGFDADQDGWTTCEGDLFDNDPRYNGIEMGGLGWQDISCLDGLDNDLDGVIDCDC